MPRRPHALPATAAGLATAAALAWPMVASASEGGLDIIPEPKRVLALLLLFLVMVPVLNALLFQPILRVLEERDQRIDGARVRANELAQQAAVLLGRHDEAVRQARAAAHAERSGLVEEARAQHRTAIGTARATAERDIASARAEIQQASASVRQSLRVEAEQIAREIAARLLGRTPA